MHRIVVTRFSAWAAFAWLAVVFVLAAAPLGLAQPLQDTSNAATWYRRAYERLDGITPEQWTLIIEYQKVGGAPSAEVRGLLQRAQPAIADLQRATNQSYSDFGLDPSKGVFIEMPHLGGMRQLIKLATADAAMRIADGDGAGAAAEIASLCRMADQLSDDHVLVSSIISGAMFNMTSGAIDAGFDAAVFTDAETALLLNSMKSFDERDPFGSVDAMVGEQLMGIETIRNALVAGNQAAFEDFAAVYGLDDASKDQLVSMDAQTLQAGLQDYSTLMDLYVAAFENEDREAAQAEIARLDEACANGEFGLIVSVFRADFAPCHDVLGRFREMLAQRIDSLEKILGGEVDAGELANAAVWYRRGIEKLADLDEAWNEDVAHVDPRQPMAPEAIARLEDGAEEAAVAITEFVDGSKVRRCDFSPGRDEREAFVPLYADGMRDAFRLLMLEALHREAGGDSAGATQILSAAFRVAAHLSGDRLIVSSLVARDGFLMTAHVGQSLHARGSLDATGLGELSAAIRQCGPGDPFGFIAASAESRKSIRTRLLERTLTRDREARAAEFDDWLSNVDADGLIYLLAMQDAMEYSLEPRESFIRAGAARLGEYLLSETIELAGMDAPAFAELIRKSVATSFVMPDTVRIVGATARMASARRDLWDAVAWERELQAAAKAKAEARP